MVNEVIESGGITGVELPEKCTIGSSLTSAAASLRLAQAVREHYQPQIASQYWGVLELLRAI